ncbi:uncharacterized protein N7459_007926 [Penicillium hispanicum]|uniref:uncharacterized protein n=1 Tax=Penicillium hispanicum TaxID=1080232 RepID=UPI00253FB1CD|nr:uncharacterized protein N7459_007926 [Penicillium hispanicum]KAJ5573499.1 hypothetical protein N7459_007926 [Penicillium hispanicum]
MDKARTKIIEDNPIGEGLNFFRSTYESKGVSPDALDHLGYEVLPASGRGKSLLNNLLNLMSSVDSEDFHLDRIKPVLKAALAHDSKDALIWENVYLAVVECTPPPRQISSSIQQTPWLTNTSGFANSSEYRQDVDRVLKAELGTLYVGVRGFHERFFGGVAGLETASRAVLKKCTEGDDPLLDDDGWVGWPRDANQDGVLNWLAETIEKLATFAESYSSAPTTQRRPLAQPNKPVEGSMVERKIDIGLVNDPDAGRDSLCHWRQILVPGELKSNPSADIASKAWLDLGRYAREVLAAQDTRRYVLGFTICGSLIRIWEFDRLGGIASDKFDIHKDALRFVSTILGFLWMSDEQLGFDPTILTLNGQRFIEVKRSGHTERLFIDKMIRRAPCVAGRATTCWRAYREGDPQRPLVIKDSWQYTERMDEGELLRETTDKGVINVARYYHHETVQILGTDDDVQHHVRKGLDVTTADNYVPERLSRPRRVTTARKSRSITGVKRSSSQTGLSLPPPKRRSSSQSPTKTNAEDIPNRIHRRVVISDYGEPIYKASSRVALLRAFEGCIKGHKSLLSAAESLHRDISINNMMINEDSNNPSWPTFLIDLDLSIKESRTEASGAKGRTGTRAFMAIGVLLGESHSFMHDLESFFWVLFWICIHYDSPGQGRVVPNFDKWNYADMEELAKLKLGTVLDEDVFRRTTTELFTEYYRPLTPWVNRLRRVVFPGGRRWKAEDEGLYSSMINVLHAAQEDPNIWEST